MKSLEPLFEPKDIIHQFERIYNHQEPCKLLTSVSLYIIHTDRYDKPYRSDVKEIIDKHKKRILRLIENKELNSKNAFDKTYISQLNNYNELAEYECILAFEDLIEENETVYKLCLQTMKDNNVYYSELLKGL